MHYIPANGKLLRVSDFCDLNRWFKVKKAEFNVDIIGTNARVEALLDIESEHSYTTICQFALTTNDFYERIEIKIGDKIIQPCLEFANTYAASSDIVLYSQKTYVFDKLIYFELKETFPN